MMLSIKTAGLHASNANPTTRSSCILAAGEGLGAWHQHWHFSHVSKRSRELVNKALCPPPLGLHFVDVLTVRWLFVPWSTQGGARAYRLHLVAALPCV